MSDNFKDWNNQFSEHISAENSKKLAQKFEDDFVTPSQISEFNEMQGLETSAEPKQVVFNTLNKRAYVSCMAGKSVNIFELKNRRFEPIITIPFNLQCVEVETSADFTFVTLTDFSHITNWNNYLAIIDNKTNKEISRIKTGGVWPKFIRINEQRKELLISNWKSNNISVVSIENPYDPKLIQVLDCGKSPRGIEFFNNGQKALIAGYYSRNIVELQATEQGYVISHISQPFDYPNYSGNMRDVVIQDEFAYFSNMGRNKVVQYSIAKREVTNIWSVGKFPNSIRFINNQNLIVSCRESNAIQLLNIATGALQSVLGEYNLPTGLCIAPQGFLSTQFGSNKLSYFTIPVKNEEN